MKKIYLAGGISDIARKKYHKEMAQMLRDMGFFVYSASENDSINDKSNNPTPEDIYNADIKKIMECDIFLPCITGGNEDGTISEIGVVAGWNEMVENHSSVTDIINEHSNDKIRVKWANMYDRPIEIIAYTTNERLLDPDISQGIPSARFNHLVLGMIQKWGLLVGGEDDMLKYMREIAESNVKK